MEEHDVVALKADRPQDGLRAGEEGAIVMVLAPDALLVEFVDDQGMERAMPVLRPDEVELVWRVGDPVESRRASA